MDKRLRAGFALLFLLACGSAWAQQGNLIPVYWPTPDGEYFQTGDIMPLLQPTASGRPESGLYGLVRNGGTRFHEGIDLKPMGRDRNGEATDPIYAAMAGRVAYVNRIAGNSGYGRYVVIEHTQLDVPVYTLYAHMADIDSRIQAGVQVEAGGRLGRMGRSAGGYSIPKSRSHLHFEIGLRDSNRFQDFYNYKRYGGKNQHGNYNGINLTGMDPLRFFERARTGRLTSMRELIQSQPVAFTLQVSTRQAPDFITRYPALLTQPIPAQGLTGWEIDYTSEGMPIRWTPLTSEDVGTRREGDIALLNYNEEALSHNNRDTLLIKNGKPSLGSGLKNSLQLIFGFR
ncbi:M23 family metallopeptidase [Ruficoccus amylovorans]|uniref:M23 family metallopeptidase n=1 Tax=Ruficoccus amylovorans TaxID=1804625 RepID=A0A842HFG1_9BACT|nr:M23 family metallopeptidase [Ruficoccus amylovorans]MBC2594254.1 M23 family metallopeptidase [Ruficoccus amylovorans]